MELGETQYEVRALDLVKIKELGRGAYGIVETMLHPPSGTIMAVKVRDFVSYVIKVLSQLNFSESTRLLILRNRNGC